MTIVARRCLFGGMTPSTKAESNFTTDNCWPTAFKYENKNFRSFRNLSNFSIKLKQWPGDHADANGDNFCLHFTSERMSSFR